MKGSNFMRLLRYIFTPRAIAWWLVLTAANSFAYGLCNVLHNYPMAGVIQVGLVVKYVIFCSAYVITNAVRWYRYRRLTPNPSNR